MKVIEKAWHPLGFASDLANPGDYVAARFGGTEIAAWRDENGDVVGFDNLCPHRGARIFPFAHGNMRFLCRYHGLSVRCGKFSAPPSIGLPEGVLQLRKAEVVDLGGVVFASLDPLWSLAGQLGPDLVRYVSDLGRTAGKRFSTQSRTWNCDWKVAVENAVDEPHTPIVHRETLAPLIENPSRFSRGLNSVYCASLKDRRIGALKFGTPSRFNHLYTAIYLFPFSQLVTTSGHSVTLNRWTPHGDLTLHQTSIYEGGARQDDAAGAAYLRACLDMDERVFAEDRVAVSRVQPGFKGVLGRGDDQVRWFRESLASFENA